jgi:hypothetical protein
MKTVVTCFIVFLNSNLNRFLQAVPRPRNDNCENATVFSGLPMSKSGYTYGSLSDEPLDICSTSTNNRGVWYSVTPSFTRNITVATSVASFHHEIVIFAGDSCDTATCDGMEQVSSYSTNAAVTFVAEARTKYFVLVTGYNGIYDAFDDVGTYNLKITGDGRAPPSVSPTRTPVGGIIDTPVKVPVRPPVRRMRRGMMMRYRNYYYGYSRASDEDDLVGGISTKGMNIFASRWNP